MSVVYIPAKDFETHKNPDDMIGYQWNDRVVDALFCKCCGIFPYFGNEEYGYRVNLGCVEQIDALKLDISILDGRSMLLSDDPGPHPLDPKVNT